MWAKPKPRSATIKSIPAPTKGINDYDSIANMDPMFALDMLNLFPNAKSLEVRSGYREWLTGLGAAAKTLMPYNAASGSNQLWVSTDAGIYNATTSGAAPAPSIVLTNGYMSSVTYSNVAGQYLVAVNGVDMGKFYNGTVWADMVTTVASTQNMICVTSYSKRLWFAEKGTNTAWYLPVDAITGALTPFYLGGIFTMGGFLQNIFTWSMDSGEDLDDILVFQSSKGEIVGYMGPDPSSPSTFAFQARYYVGDPLGTRVTTDFGGDVAMLSVGGVVPISKVVGGTQAISKDEDTLSKNISKTLNTLISSRGSNPGWEILNVPALTSMFITFPDTGGEDAIQLVMNTLTGAWTRYDLPLKSMVEYNRALYFSDEVGRILYLDPNNDLDNLDISGASGQFIVSGVTVAYNYFDMPGVDKVYGMIRPLFVSAYTPSILTNISVDFSPNPIYGIPAPSGGPTSVDFWDTALWDVNNWFAPNAPTQADVWDTGVWDSTLWSPPVTVQYNWIGAGQMGYAASLALKMATNAPTEFVSCDWSFIPATSL